MVHMVSSNDGYATAFSLMPRQRSGTTRVRHPRDGERARLKPGRWQPGVLAAQTSYKHTYVCIYMYGGMSECISMHAQIVACMHACMHACRHAHVCLHVCTHINVRSEGCVKVSWATVERGIVGVVLFRESPPPPHPQQKTQLGETSKGEGYG